MLIDIIRRLEYRWLCVTGLRGEMGAYVPTIFVSCEHHCSNLVSVLVDSSTYKLDCPDGVPATDPSDPTGKRQLAEKRGNKAGEKLT